MADMEYADRDGVKLCEADRPPFQSIMDRLNQRVSQKLVNLFVADIQNDCACSTETYDAGFSDCHMFYTSPEGIKLHVIGERLPLPMKSDFSEKDIWDLLKAASAKASAADHGFNINQHMLYNTESDVKKLWEVFEKHCHPVHVNRSGDITGWIAAPFVPKECVFFTPEPEFFGAISVNIDKFGAFCIAKNMVRIQL